MARQVQFFKGTIGLDNTQGPTRTALDPREGIVELAEAWNIEIDDTGRPYRRAGYTSTARTEDSHSMYTGRAGTFFMSGTTLYRLNEDLTRTAVGAGLTADAITDYEEVLDTIYFANGYEIGKIVNGVSSAWTVGTYVGPTTTRQFSAPPVGHLLEVYNGIMYIAAKNVLWGSEPFGYNLFDTTRNFVWFEDKITMVKAVADGMYVSTEKKVVFLKGLTTKDFQQIDISNYPAIPGTGITVNAEEILKGQATGDAAIWTALNGIYLGLNGGECKRMTEQRITLPQVNSGCAVFHNGRYLVSLKK